MKHLNNRGFSLVSVLLSFAMVLIATYGTMTFFEGIQKTQVSMNSTLSDMTLRSRIRSVLDNPTLCKKAFDNYTINTASLGTFQSPAPITGSRPFGVRAPGPDGTTASVAIAEVDKQIESLIITDVKLKVLGKLSAASYLAQIKITYKNTDAAKAVGTVGTPETEANFNVTLNMNANGTTVDSCGKQTAGPKVTEPEIKCIQTSYGKNNAYSPQKSMPTTEKLLEYPTANSGANIDINSTNYETLAVEFKKDAPQYTWGIRCRDENEWVLTGCSYANNGTAGTFPLSGAPPSTELFDFESWMKDNTCFSRSAILNGSGAELTGRVYATCCKIYR